MVGRRFSNQCVLRSRFACELTDGLEAAELRAAHQAALGTHAWHIVRRRQGERIHETSALLLGQAAGLWRNQPVGAAEAPTHADIFRLDVASATQVPAEFAAVLRLKAADCTLA